MRGKLAKTKDRWLQVVSLVEFLIAGQYVYDLIKTPRIMYLIGAASFAVLGASLYILYWLSNHPKIPKWMEDVLIREDIALSPFRNTPTKKDGKHG